MDVEVVRLDRNLGYLAPWSSEEVHATLAPHASFVVTDCDVVPDDGCPADAGEHLASMLLAPGDIDKVGLGLRIDDLPDSYTLRRQVVDWESQF